MDDAKRRLLWHGAFLFLLGLLTGLAQAHFTNMRMGLAAHLEGVMNGIFLIAVGAIWEQVALAPRAERAAFRLLLYATYANWAVTCLAAIFGTASLTPLAGAGQRGAPWQEVLVAAGFVSVAFAIIGATALLLWGLRRRREG